MLKKAYAVLPPPPQNFDFGRCGETLCSECQSSCGNPPSCTSHEPVWHYRFCRLYSSSVPGAVLRTNLIRAEGECSQTCSTHGFKCIMGSGFHLLHMCALTGCRGYLPENLSLLTSFLLISASCAATATEENPTCSHCGHSKSWHVNGTGKCTYPGCHICSAFEAVWTAWCTNRLQVCCHLTQRGFTSNPHAGGCGETCQQCNERPCDRDPDHGGLHLCSDCKYSRSTVVLAPLTCDAEPTRRCSNCGYAYPYHADWCPARVVGSFDILCPD